MITDPSNIKENVPVGTIERDAPTRIVLQPLAAPSILGLFGFAGATFMVAANMAGWFGTPDTPFFLFPLAAFFGGLAQFLAGMWAFKARDGMATAMHGTWGSFWMAYGLLYFLGAAGYVDIPAGGFPELGFWFVILAVTTWAGVIAAFADNLAMALVLIFLAAGSTLSAVGMIIGLPTITMIAGWCFIISALIAWYTATGLMVNSAYGREVWSLGKFSHAEEKPCVSAGVCEPGVMHGQS